MRQRTHCPRCNSRQEFAHRSQHLEGNIYRIYIECDMCHWMNQVKLTTPEKERLLKQITKIRKKIERSGPIPPISLVKLLDRKMKQYERS